MHTHTHTEREREREKARHSQDRVTLTKKYNNIMLCIIDDVYEIMRSFLCLAEGSDGQTKMTSIIDFCGHAIERIKSCVPESTAEWKSKVQDHLTSIYRIAEHGGAYFTNDNSTTVIKEAQTSNVVVPAVTVVPAVSIKALPLVQPTSTPPSVRRSQIRKGSVSLLSSTPSPSPSAGPRRSSSWTKLRRIDTCCDKKGPYHKGTLSFQQLAPRKKAEEQESWKSCWAVLEHGQLVLFHSRESVGSKVPLLTVPTQNESESHFKTELFLGHSMAQESNRRNTFVLQLANNVAYLFDCGSEDQVRVWVDHCNMWAAIESKIKLASVTTCLDWDPMSALMQLWHWRPTPLSAGTSMLNREDQVKTIQIYLDDLQKDQRWHASLYDLIIKLPADTPHYADLYKNWHYKCWHTSRTMERYHIYENILILAISRSNLI
ncbi:hypothetical protein J3Q64DRAFT_1346208 [Phycomyces blakesleeanus]|uniref:PH domain-containing protein n=1 Tax=Phycomyces blakesleeanus TaxID=4837 RepID=A0ABR3AM38_PHYBL